MGVCPFLYNKRKYNARDFDKSKAANLLKMLKGEHPTNKWQNCGTEVLCVMLMYDEADLTRIVNKVLGKHFSFLETKLLFRTICVALNLLNFHVCI